MSRICNNLQCDPRRPYSGPLQWLTITWGYIEPYEMATLPNSQGVVILGSYYGSSYLNSTYNADGIFTFGLYGDANAQYGSSLHVARGGIYVYWEAADRYCPGFGNPCTYFCTTTSPSGDLGNVAHLVGRNDAGYFAAVVRGSSPPFDNTMRQAPPSGTWTW